MFQKQAISISAAAGGQPQNPAESSADEIVETSPVFDPFPTPNTIPGGWDLSEWM
jgi:hypothetical protein